MFKSVLLSATLLGILFIGCNKEKNLINHSIGVKCEQGNIDRSAICPTVYSPVCGCNDVTYSNSCKAEADGISNYVNGACKTNKSFNNISAPNDCVGKPTLGVACPAVYDPVCGCNDVTYSNSCEASIAGVSSYVKGACGASDKSFMDISAPNDCVGKPTLGVACPAVYEPVCGCNNVTYSNSCEAGIAGVYSYVKGECVASNNEF